MNLDNLSKEGFVFLGNDKKYWLCKMWGTNPWFFYMHPDGMWVSYTQVNQIQVWRAYDQKVPDEIAEECNRKAKMIQ